MQFQIRTLVWRSVLCVVYARVFWFDLNMSGSPGSKPRRRLRHKTWIDLEKFVDNPIDDSERPESIVSVHPSRYHAYVPPRKFSSKSGGNRFATIRPDLKKRSGPSSKSRPSARYPVGARKKATRLRVCKKQAPISNYMANKKHADFLRAKAERNQHAISDRPTPTELCDPPQAPQPCQPLNTLHDAPKPVQPSDPSLAIGDVPHDLMKSGAGIPSEKIKFWKSRAETAEFRTKQLEFRVTKLSSMEKCRDVDVNGEIRVGRKVHMKGPAAVEAARQKTMPQAGVVARSSASNQMVEFTPRCVLARM